MSVDRLLDEAFAELRDSILASETDPEQALDLLISRWTWRTSEAAARGFMALKVTKQKTETWR